MENPGYSRTGKEQMRKGVVSDPRNKTLMKMFNLINIGERAGRGVPNIFNVWYDEGWTVIRFWGKDIMNHTDECIKVIEEVIWDSTIEDEELTTDQ